jgi:predicted component of viral defense system (DUF524 family)
MEISIPTTNKKIFLKIIWRDLDACVLYKQDAEDYGVAAYQLKEGSKYFYQLTVGYILREDEIVSRNPVHESEGEINTGIYVGTLRLKIYESKDKEDLLAKPTAYVNLEIVSKKIDYLTDYKIMLEDLTRDYAELVMMQGSPVTRRFIQDNNGTPQTEYQRFAFVKSILESDQFIEAIYKINASPVKQWESIECPISVNGIKRIGRREIRQILTSHDRVTLPKTHPLSSIIGDIPRRVVSSTRRDTLDTPENRFIKFVLESFMSFCSSMIQKRNASNRLKNEATVSVKKLANLLRLPIFRSVTQLRNFQFNIPVLQRKEGYREVLQTWMMFDLAAKLTWKGADDVFGQDYDAGLKNIAALYEYWLFFKLVDVISEVFKLSPKSLSELVHPDEDMLVLDLKEGHTEVIEGVYDSGLRKLNVRLYYNRTFSRSDEDKAGSWTLKMRPDYTLSIWTGDITEVEAEQQDLIVHLHFDAKYRLQNIFFDENVTEEELTEEKKEEESNIYKRGDLLKMHAYKDAIRRTCGAYILYPGNTYEEPIRCYHEIIPGLGAFCIRPNSYNEDKKHLKKFIEDVVANFLNRISQREQMAFYQYKVSKQGEQKLRVILPESVNENRDFMPLGINVLIGFLPERNREWVTQKLKYNIRFFNDERRVIKITPAMLAAKYIVLYDSNVVNCNTKIYKVDKEPEVCTFEIMKYLGYPNPKPEHSPYLVYYLSEAESELKDCQFDVKSLNDKRMEGIKDPHIIYSPFTVTLAELMNYKLKDGKK